MKISVIIPVYDAEEWIEAAVLSVLEQDYPNLECVIIDDFGTDRSMDIVLRLRADHPRKQIMKIAVHALNLGLAGARNTGITASTGEYIFYLDADDKLADTGTISAMAAAAEKYHPDLVQGNYLRVDPETGDKVISLYYNASTPCMDRDQIIENYGRLNFVNATNKLISREFLSENHIMFYDGIIYEDALWAFHVYTCIKSVVTIPEVTYYHNLRHGSIMRSPVTEQKIDSLIFIVGKMCRSKQRDSNINQSIAINSAYALKSLFTEDFPAGFRSKKLRELLNTGVRKVRFNRKTLPPFSRRLSYALSLPLPLAMMYSWLLSNLYHVYKMKKNKADVKG